MTPETAAGATAARALPELEPSLLGNAQLLYFLRLLKRAKLRRHLHLGAAMKQVIDG